MKKLNISQVDTIFANGSYPIEFLVYYKNKLNHKNIRRALKSISSLFWPAFGKYDGGIIHFEKYDENRHFDQSELNREFDPQEEPQKLHELYHDAIPTDIDSLFFLKIIDHKNGSVLIPKMNHLAGDGYSYFYLLSVLAALSQQNYIPFKKYMIKRMYKPYHNRTVLQSFLFDQGVSQMVKQPQKLMIRYEKIMRSELRSLIKKTSHSINKNVSANDILSAMVIQKIINNQSEFIHESFKLTIPIDVRRYIKEFGIKFFGNAIMFQEVNFHREEIEKPDVTKIAAKIRNSMPRISKDVFMKFMDKLESLIEKRSFDRLRPFDPEKGCLVTNLSRLPSDKLNFGSGEADFIVPLTVEKNSTAILADKEKFVLRLAY